MPATVVQHILETAQRTASWCNTQPWHVVITAQEGTERFRRDLAAEARQAESGGPQGSDFEFPRQYQGACLERRRVCGAQLYASLGIGREDRQARAAQALENFSFFGAPHVAIITTPELLGAYGAIDCGAYVNSFMLACQSVGVASVAQASLAKHSGFIRRYFGLSESRRVVCGISFGYADDSHPVNQFRTARAEIASVVQWATD